jgi:hypothetical protein
VLGRIVGRKRDEVTGGWRKLHSDKLHNLYSSPNIIRMKRDGIGGKRPLGSSRHSGRIILK